MYSDITANKRKTWILMSGFFVFLMLILTVLGMMLEAEPGPFFLISAVVSTVYMIGAYLLADSVVLSSQGAKEVSKEQAFELYTMVENLSITAGVPMPKVYVIDDEAPNAFATGRNPEHSAVAVTTGLLKRLNKTELEGVLAHELSHIRNYDIRLMTLVVVFIGLTVLIADILWRIPFIKNNNKDNGQAALVILVIGLAFALLSPLIAQIIRLAVSRTREYLADSSGAMLTRHPEGLASALEKISSVEQPLKRANHATAHLYISSPFGGKSEREPSFFDRMFMTHPPARDRIARLRGMGR